MNDFNLMNVLTNILVNKQNIINAQNKTQIQNNQNQNANSQIFAQNQQNTTLKSTYNQIFETSSLSNMINMDNQAVSKYIQSLLEFPDSITKFIQEALKNQDNSQVEKLIKILTDESLDTEKLSKLLNENSKTAIDKVLKSISASINSANTDINQLKDILKVLNIIQQTTSNNSTEALRELLLLYIPLNIQTYELSNFKNISSENENIINNSILTIIFQTLNFKNAIASLNEYNDKFLITLAIDNLFPKTKFEKIVGILCEKLNIKFSIEYKNRNIDEDENEIQNFKVFSNKIIPIKMLFLAHIMIETIFKIDSNFS